MCHSPPSDEYALALNLGLKHISSHGIRYGLAVDATPACCGSGPSAVNVALYGHSCMD